MNKTILVLINGYAGVGKDTFVDFCQQYAETKGYKVCNLHRSDAPKAALKSLGWDGVKDAETREILKAMIDYMEIKGLLNKYLEQQIELHKAHYEKDNIVFYHVRDPEVIYSLMEKYINNPAIRPISLLIKRDIENPEEPQEWWGDLEKAEYTMTVQLPSKDLNVSREAAEVFVDFLLNEEWEVVKQEESSWILNA